MSMCVCFLYACVYMRPKQPVVSPSPEAHVIPCIWITVETLTSSAKTKTDGAH